MIILLYLIVLSVPVPFILGLFALRHRDVAGASSFAALMACAAESAIASCLYSISNDFQTKLFWTNMNQFGVNGAAITALAFALEYTGRDKWLKPSRLFALSYILLVQLALMWTNDLHHLQRLDVTLVQAGEFTKLEIVRGPFFWISMPYTVMLVIAGLLIFFQAWRYGPLPYRQQAGMVVLAFALTLILNVATIAQINPLAPFDISIITFLPSGLILAYALFRHRFLNVSLAARYQIIDNLDEGVLVLDGQGRIIEVNPPASKILGELCLKKSWDWVGLSTKLLLVEYPEWLRSYADDAVHQITIERGTGEDFREYEIRVFPFRNQRGHLTGHLTLLRDTTRLKLATQQSLALAFEQERAGILHNLLQATSHDLRTPLTTIGTSLYVAQRLTQDLEVQLTSLAAQISTGEQAQALITLRELLDKIQTRFGAIERSKERLQIIIETMFEVISLKYQLEVKHFPKDLNAIVRSQIAIIQPQAQEKNLTLATSLDANLPLVMVDEIKVGRALSHVLNNAVLYTHAGGIIHAQTLSAHDAVAIKITDTGMGIAPDDLTHIFDMFYRVDEARSTETGGAGLGLSIAKLLVEAHGGHITVESAVGQGSTFELSFPTSGKLITILGNSA